ncbi:MAG: RNA polymerase sigma factor [Myxococcota bacterium]
MSVSLARSTLWSTKEPADRIRLRMVAGAEPTPSVLEAAQAGDPEALEAVLRYLHPVILRFLSFKFGAAGSPVEDACQDCMVEIIRSLPGYRSRGSLKAWAMKLSFRTARRNRQREALERGLSLDDFPEAVFSVTPGDRAPALDLLRAMRSLTPKKRDALLLVEVFGLTAKEAAGVVGTLENTIRSRARHAKEELAVALEPGGAS